MTHSLREAIERIAASTGVYEQESLKDELRALVRMALEQASEICEQIGVKAWAEYKTGTGPSRANPHIGGMSDGADDCATAIRAFAAQLTPGQEDHAQEGRAQARRPRVMPTSGASLEASASADIPASGSPNAQTERREKQRRFDTSGMWRGYWNNRAADRRKANAQAPAPEEE